MDRRLEALSTVAALNRRLFLNCQEGLLDEDLCESYYIGQLSLMTKSPHREADELPVARQ